MQLSILLYFLPVGQVDSNVSNSKNDGRNDHEDISSIDAQKEKGDNGQRRSGYGDAEQTAVEITHGFSASEIPDPENLI